jgi:hypothetical protein
MAAATAISACGASHHAQDAGEHGHRTFPVAVSASFPALQRLAQRSRLVIDVRNTGTAAIPNVAVTITNPLYHTAAQAFGELIPPSGQGQPILASRSRPIWIVLRNPGPCGYSCRHGGAGAAATAYSNTWALGRLEPGATARFAWLLTAIQPGTYIVSYRVAPGLSVDATAVRADGRPVSGSLRVRISSVPRQAFVENDGRVVYSP